MNTLIDLKTLKAGDTLRIVDATTNNMHTTTVAKAGAAHLLLTFGGGQPDVRINRATGAQVSAKPTFYVCDVAADLAGNTYDARHFVNDMPLDDVDVAALNDAFGATDARAQVVTRVGGGTAGVVVAVGGRTFSSPNAEGLSALIAQAVASVAPAAAPAVVETPAAPAVVDAPAAYVLTNDDRALVARVAKANADMKSKDGTPSPFTPGYFAQTKSLMKAANGSERHLSALCAACATAGNTLLGIVVEPDAAPAVAAPAVAAPAAPKAKRTAKPAAATLPAVSAETPHGVRALSSGRTLHQTHAADAATAGRAVSFDEYLAACDAAPASAPAAPAAAPIVETPAPVAAAPAQAPIVDEQPVAATTDDRHPLVVEFDAALSPAARSQFRASLIAFLTAQAAAPAKPARAARAAAPAKTPGARAAAAPVGSNGMTPRDEDRAGAIGRKVAATRSATGPVTSDEVLAFGHPRMDRVPAARRTAVATAAAQVANTILSGGAKPARAPRAARSSDAPKAPAVAASKPIVAGCTADIRPEFSAEYDGTLTPDERHGLTVVKVSGARVFAKTAAGDEVRLPLAHLIAV